MESVREDAPLLSQEDIEKPQQILFNDIESNKTFSLLDTQLKNEVTQTEFQVRHTTHSTLQDFESFDFLKALLLSHEQQLPVQPLQLSSITCTGWKEPIYSATATLTNNRMVVTKISKAERSTLKNEKSELKTPFFVTDQLSVEHITSNGSFFYPIPLKNIRGMAFKSSQLVTAAQTLQKHRYIFLLALTAVFVFAGIAAVLAVEFNVQDADTLQFMFEIMFPCLGFVVFGSVIAFCVCTYIKRFPIQTFPTQTKTVELGFVDPITQNTVVAYLEVESGVTLHEIKDFLTILQQQCPFISGNY